MTNWLQKEINWWGKEHKITEWMLMAMEWATVTATMGTVFILLNLAQYVDMLTLDFTKEGTLIFGVGLWLIAVVIMLMYSYWYVKLNPKEPK